MIRRFAENRLQEHHPVLFWIHTHQLLVFAIAAIAIAIFVLAATWQIYESLKRGSFWRDVEDAFWRILWP